MKNTFKTLLAGSMVAMFAPLSVAAAQSGEKAGVNAAIRNEVNQTLISSGETMTAEVGGGVFIGDIVTTGDASAAQILLEDETTVTLGFNAALVIDEFVYDPSRDASQIAASVSKGVFRVFSGRTGQREVDVNTPVASVGIRGTFAELAIGEPAMAFARAQGLDPSALNEDSALVILRGPGRGNSGINKMGELDVSNSSGTITLSKANTAVLVPSKSAAMIGPFVVVPEGQRQLIRSYVSETDIGSVTSPVPYDVASLPPVRPPSDFLPPAGPNGHHPQDRPTSGCLFLFENDVPSDTGQSQSFQDQTFALCEQLFSQSP